MARLLPYKGAGLDRLVALANFDNATAHAIQTVFTLSAPAVSAGASGRNTAVEVFPVDAANYKQQTLRYRRLSLAVLSALPVGEVLPVVITALPFTIHEILPQLNEALGLDLLPSEVTNTTYSTAQTGYTLSIASASSSYAWVQSSFEFVADLQIAGARYRDDGQLRTLSDGSIRMIDGFTPVAA